jgi:hypothetical protein
LLEDLDRIEWTYWQASYSLDGDEWMLTSAATASIVNAVRASTATKELKPEQLMRATALVPYIDHDAAQRLEAEEATTILDKELDF